MSAYVFLRLDFVASSLLSGFPLDDSFTMSLLAVNTVDRLDRPSAYYVGKVSFRLAGCNIEDMGNMRGWIALTIGPRTRDADIMIEMRSENTKRRRIRWPNCAMRQRSTSETCTIIWDATQHATTSLTDHRSFYTTEEQIHELFSK